MNKALVTPLLLSASLIACNAPSNEETAAQAAAAVGQSVSALTTNAAIADEAATAQTGQPDDPKAPDGVEGTSCVTTQLTQAGLRVDFGTGCTINGHTYAGAYTIRVSLFGGLSVSLDFDSFVVDGRTQQGDISIGVGRGFVSAHADLAIDDGSLRQEISLDGELRVENQNLDFNGSGRYADGTIDVSLAATGLHSVVGQCYADAGSVTVEAVGYPTAVVTFDASTPSTGIVTVTVGNFSMPQALPPTPNCPAT
jgi:hypothetical protein